MWATYYKKDRSPEYFVLAFNNMLEFEEYEKNQDEFKLLNIFESEEDEAEEEILCYEHKNKILQSKSVLTCDDEYKALKKHFKKITKKNSLERKKYLIEVYGLIAKFIIYKYNGNAEAASDFLRKYYCGAYESRMDYAKNKLYFSKADKLIGLKEYAHELNLNKIPNRTSRKFWQWAASEDRWGSNVIRLFPYDKRYHVFSSYADKVVFKPGKDDFTNYLKYDRPPKLNENEFDEFEEAMTKHRRSFG